MRECDNYLSVLKTNLYQMTSDMFHANAMCVNIWTLFTLLSQGACVATTFSKHGEAVN